MDRNYVRTRNNSSWIALMIAFILIMLGVLYIAGRNNQINNFQGQGVIPGIGGGPVNIKSPSVTSILPSVSPSPTISPSTTPAPSAPGVNIYINQNPTPTMSPTH